MSHFAVYTCNVSNMEFVKKGLAEMGLGFKENTQITDWYGQNRQAELAVVKDGTVLPLGWVRENGELGLQADWYKVPYSEKQFTDQISQLHSKYQVLEVCEENRWNVDAEDITMNANGEIEIIATQFA
ncbi:DUF1257 domain-containing protein [Bacillus toyonensis]|uniref:DUF1257 domain-containing protein n=1 Tax=Bacillus thuringiensis TaxID=1428 RepID=A0A9X7BTY7_BACTU|nr:MULTISPECIES: DUF1257 domain-containing protein [Bacillus cereus group]MED1301971.1 DUF1257 domain-containing protein [Bacillus pacificus]CUB54092.1 hypothetical protein BN2127_JRS10_02608 [Bacillus subtilis]MCU5224043.1 DUF1257 domain-containing protein [Bacillus tropicus]MCU5503665.1 DUF1257 domain-containing protein [Bacillus cereus]MDR5047840.1 DUF1257 domain-containing protein [Bacillus thuringiensis]